MRQIIVLKMQFCVDREVEVNLLHQFLKTLDELGLTWVNSHISR